MALNRLSFLMFFIPIVIGINTTVSEVRSAANNNTDNVILAHNATLPKVVNNSLGDLPIMTEGGSIGTKQTVPIAVKNATLLSKPKADPVLDIPGATLIKTMSDPLLDIPLKNTGKSVVARKGVDFKAVEKDIANGTVRLQPKKTESTPIPHKPTVLAYGALQSSDDKTLSLLEEKLKLKQATNPGSHPGMIMPVVITILVVPMFAVLGYMALKRGQEAWKNRHYKRMDFLLDGMYND